jgi:hypothetical protein
MNVQHILRATAMVGRARSRIGTAKALISLIL